MHIRNPVVRLALLAKEVAVELDVERHAVGKVVADVVAVDGPHLVLLERVFVGVLLPQAELLRRVELERNGAVARQVVGGVAKALGVALVDAHGDANGKAALLQELERSVGLNLGARHAAQPVVMAETIEAQLKGRVLMPTIEDIERVGREQGGVGKYHADVDAMLRERFDDLLEVVAHQRLATRNVHAVDATRRHFAHEVHEVLERQLRMVRARRRNETMATLKVALARNAPVDGVDVARRKHVVALPRLQRLHRLGRLLHVVVFHHLAYDLLRDWVERLDVHVLLAVAIEKIKERLLRNEHGPVVFMLAKLCPKRVRRALPAPKRPGLLQSIIHVHLLLG